ncbi:MAG: ABC transporter permease, partial [Candidatus Acidiferrales bacterium]
DWDPSFPVELSRIRPRDEDYWDKYRTTPKAFLRLDDGQRLWRSRYGQLTAMRFIPLPGADLTAAAQDFSTRLRDALDPSQAGFVTIPVRAQGLDASRGAVNFGEYFVYFSFFIVVSAALLAGLFFRLGVEQRLREIGLLRAIGFPERRIARLFLSEGAALAVLGSALGLAGAIAYGTLLVYGLRTWWVGSVGTTLLRLHISTLTLVAGAAGGLLIALIVITLTLRGLRKATPVNLLAGARQFTAAGDATPRRTSRALTLGILCAILGLALLAAAAAGHITQAGGFFGAGFLLLTALLFFNWAWLAGDRKHLLAGAGAAGLSRLGLRNASWRPGRSLLCIALIASATFLIVAVDSFRRGDIDPLDPRSGTGGYPLLAESLLPIPYDLATPQGREAAGLDASQLQSAAPSAGDLELASFRLRPGDDASCLNLYQPQNPRILGASPEFVSAARFSFQSSLARTAEEEQNPWQLLASPFDDGAIPAIADANSLTYVLHRKLGEDFVLEHVRDPRTGQPVHLRLVAALADSIFQSELIISEDHFQRLFAREPSAAGYRVFLIRANVEAGSEGTRHSSRDLGSAVTALEESLSPYGFDVISTADRLAAFHRVENTYLSTFQALGG